MGFLLQVGTSDVCFFFFFCVLRFADRCFFQLMEDCHDCLRAAISVKHTYVALVQLVGLENKELLENLADFENHLSEVFKVPLA